MYDIQAAKQRQHDYWANHDYEYGVNSIRNFAFSDAGLVPQLFREFAVEYYGLERYSRVDIERLNKDLNELWDGPGSAAKISDIIWDIRIARRAGAPVKDALEGYATPTVDSELEVEDDDE